MANNLCTYIGVEADDIDQTYLKPVYLIEKQDIGEGEMVSRNYSITQCSEYFQSLKIMCEEDAVALDMLKEKITAYFF